VKTVMFEVAGMTCGGCAARVERAIREIEGVSEVSVEVARGRAVVTFDAAIVAVSLIEAASARAGYPAHATPLAAVS